MRRDRSGLFLPRRAFVPPGVCSMLAATHLCGFGAGGGVGSLADGTQPAWNPSDKNASVTLTNSDRTFSLAAAVNGSVRSTNTFPSINRYLELVFDGDSGDQKWRFGIGESTVSLSQLPGVSSLTHVLMGDGKKANNNSEQAYGSSLTNGDIVMMAFTGDAIWFGANGTWFNSGDPAAGTGAAYTGITGTKYLIAGGGNTASVKDGTLAVMASYTYPTPDGFGKGW